jgi:hypothetical protein
LFSVFIFFKAQATRAKKSHFKVTIALQSSVNMIANCPALLLPVLLKITHTVERGIHNRAVAI